MKKRLSKGNLKEISFKDWNWDVTDCLVDEDKINAIISKRVTEIIQESLKEDGFHIWLSLDGCICIELPFTINDADTCIDIPLAEILKDAADGDEINREVLLEMIELTKKLEDE